MGPTEFWEGIGGGILWSTDIVFENVGNIFNYACIALAFVGIFIWLRHQIRYTKEANNNPDQLH